MKHVLGAVVLVIVLNLVFWSFVIWAVMTYVMPHFTFWKP